MKEFKDGICSGCPINFKDAPNLWEIGSNMRKVQCPHCMVVGNYPVPKDYKEGWRIVSCVSCRKDFKFVANRPKLK